MDSQDVAYCLHCGNNAPQKLQGLCNKTGSSMAESHCFILMQCQTCNEGLLYKSINTSDILPEMFTSEFSLSNYELLWPEKSQLHECVPGSIRKIYSEASVIKTVAPNAFANQIRRSLESVCIDRGANSKTLSQNLNELVQRGEIPSTLAEMTVVLRQLGNVGSHAGEEEITPEYVGVIDDFFRAVVEYVYIAPHKVEEFKARLEFAKKTGLQPEK